MPQHAVEPQFLVSEEGHVALGEAEGVRAGIASGGEQRRVADHVDAGVRRAVPDLGQRAGQGPGRCLDLLLDLVGAAGWVVSPAGRGIGRGPADQGGGQVQFPQRVRTASKPASLPPMPRVTSVVAADSAVSCARLVPSPVDCGADRLAMVAPLQLPSGIQLAVSGLPPESSPRK